ncbi:MAG TPA: Rrf2 family transcriptional regulator [Candidatus Omnitrophota bacterium]|nr:Rrf2 family transcriptional regulator [Candidatus Omnitrophota bacterium]HRY85782.1 Rrf2 family transcriptional regulator [Candidatus Omnitrophota bacterium]
MKLITRNTDYAMRALCHIAKQRKESVSAAEMVAALKIPRPFLRKILQTLSSEGLLRSTKGQGGGFALSRSPQKILLTDLIRIFQNTIQLNECVFKKKLCPNRNNCALKKEIDAIEQDVLKRLRGISIASLGNGHHPARSNQGKCHVHHSSVC